MIIGNPDKLTGFQSRANLQYSAAAARGKNGRMLLQLSKAQLDDMIRLPPR
jgi:hypothetical protein